MKELVRLNTFDELETWLEGLVCHHRYSGALPGLTGAAPTEHDFNEDLRASLEVVRDLRTVGERIREAEVRHLHEIEASLHFSEPELREGIELQSQRCNRCVARLMSLERLLSKAETLLEGLSRLNEVRQEEFDSVGYFLNEGSEAFRRTDSYVYLRQKYYNWKFHHVLQNQIVAGLPEDHLREDLEQVFTRFLRILALIVHAGDRMKKDFSPRRLTILLTYLYYKCRDFFGGLDDLKGRLGDEHPELKESLQITSSGLKMEAGKAFKIELRDLRHEHKLESIRARMERGLGILERSFRDAFQTFVRSLELNLELFEDQSQKYEETVQLISNLRDLLHVVRQTSEPEEEESWLRAKRSLQSFQETSLKALFAKDRQSLVRFSEELEYADPKARAFVLHRFQVYLSSLLMEVQKRSLLAARETNIV